MFRAVLKKSIATAAALAGVAAVSAVTVPAATADDCYTTTPTTTTVTLTRSIGQYGDRNAATVTVTHGQEGVPGATVYISLSGANVARTWTITLVNGKGSVSLPRGLDSGATYTVKAIYKGDGCYQGNAGSPGAAGSAYYTVERASTRVAGLGARNIKAGARPRVVGSVDSTTGRVPDGKITVSLYHNGRRAAAKTVSLSGGRFSVYFGSTRSAGKWLATARYTGARNFNASKNTTSFRVFGR